MAAHAGRITGPLAHRDDAPAHGGMLPAADPEQAARWSDWRRYLAVDALVGILGNLATTLMTCLLAFALLFPRGLLPQDYELAVVQSRFFEVAWGPLGRVLFLLVAAAFLADTWLATADAVSRLQADIVQALFARARRIPQRRLYYGFVVALTAVTSLTMLLDAPGPLIVLSALIGFLGTVIFPPALYYLNHRRLAAELPPWARPGAVSAVLLWLAFGAYALLAAAYLWTVLAR
jgi:hypothetical protein